MNIPNHVLRFIADKFDSNGWLHEDLECEELAWLLRNRKARLILNCGTDKWAVSLLDDALHFRESIQWQKEFGLTLLKPT